MGLERNPFWDNTDPKGQTTAVVHDTDEREQFIAGLRDFWGTSPNRLNKPERTSLSITFNGLFGTGSGITISEGRFPLKAAYSLKQLIQDYADSKGIPVYIKVNSKSISVYANKYSLLKDDTSYTMYGKDYAQKYFAALDREYENLYGKARKA